MAAKAGPRTKPPPTHVSKQTCRYELDFIARLLLDRLAACKVALRPILAKASIYDPPATVMESGGADLSGPQVSLLCRELHHALANHMHGRFFDFDARLQETKFACFTLTGCANLGEAIDRIATFNQMLKGSTIELGSAIHGDRIRLIATTAAVGDDAENTFLNNVLALRARMKLLSWLVGETITLTGASMSVPPPAAPETATALLHCDVAFGQRADSVEFPALYLQRAIVRNHSDMADFLTCYPFTFDTDDNQVGSLAGHIRNIYQTALTLHEPLPDVWQLAQNFGLSASTFKRRLAEEGLSARAVKDEWRRARAIQELTASSRTIDEIAEGLGFSCRKTFRQAFVRWTNMSPAKFRAEGRAA